MSRRLMLVGALAIAACGPLSLPGTRADAGSDDGGMSPAGGGTSTGGGSSTGGGTASGTGGGSLSGGGSASGGGTGTGGGSGATSRVEFAQMSIITTKLTAAITGVSGTTTDLYAVSSEGELFHSAGAEFSRVATLPVSLDDVISIGTTVVTFGSQKIFTCTTPPCDASTKFVESPFAGNAVALCGRSSNAIYAIGVMYSSSDSVLFRWNGSAWSQLTGSLPIEYARACDVAADGSLFIGGRGGVLRYSSGAQTFEPIGTHTDASYWSVRIIGDVVHAGGNYATLARRVKGVWSIASIDEADSLSLVAAIAGASPDEVIFTDSRTDAWQWWNGTAATPLSPTKLDLYFIDGMSSVTPDQHYVFGRTSLNAPIIVRVTRTSVP